MPEAASFAGVAAELSFAANRSRYKTAFMEEDSMMGEKLYKVMTGSGAASLIAGILMIVAGLSAGVVAIVSGAKLLAAKNEITF